MGTFEEQGREAGKDAGSWVIDGNTSAETARAILKGIEDGDPDVMDIQPSPLSGEWAGESVYELIPELREMEERGEHDAIDEACTAYEQGFGEGFWAEVERAARVAS